MPTALIIGITGQDGSYLAEFLLEKGYNVHGVIRRSSSFNTKRIEHLINSPLFNKSFFYHWGDLTDSSNLNSIIQKVEPDEIYNLGAQNHVKVSFDIPELTTNINALGAMRVIDCVKNYAPKTKLFQASTSEMFGGVLEEMPPNGFNEDSAFHPKSPYGVAKVYAYWIMKHYREAYNLYACNGITFNHESPRRGETFITRKITRWFGQNYKAIKAGTIPAPIQLGNLNAVRDWSHAKDCVSAQWLILQQEIPDDYVIASGTTHSVREFLEYCYHWMGLKIEWEGTDINETGWVTLNGKRKKAAVINPRYFRPSEVSYLKGDPKKIEQLGWKPEFSFEKLIDEMMKADCLQEAPIYSGCS